MDQGHKNKRNFWIIIGVIVGLILITLGVIKMNSQDSKNKSASNSSISKVSSSPTKKSAQNHNNQPKSHSKVTKKGNSTIQKGELLKKEPTMGDLDKIGIVDTNDLKKGQGTTLSQAQKLFGKPTNLTSSKNNEVTSTFANWTFNRGSSNDAISLSISFTNNKAVSKAIMGFKVNRPQKINLDAFNRIKDGFTYEQVVKELGKPNGITESLSKKKTFKTAVYSSGLDTVDTAKNTANVTFNFTANKLSSKNQTGLK